MDRAPRSVAIVRVVGAAGARRARDPVGQESAVGDVVVNRFVPEQRSPIRRAFFLAVAWRLTLVGGCGCGEDDEEEES